MRSCLESFFCLGLRSVLFPSARAVVYTVFSILGRRVSLWVESLVVSWFMNCFLLGLFLGFWCCWSRQGPHLLSFILWRWLLLVLSLLIVYCFNTFCSSNIVSLAFLVERFYCAWNVLSSHLILFICVLTYILSCFVLCNYFVYLECVLWCPLFFQFWNCGSTMCIASAFLLVWDRREWSCACWCRDWCSWGWLYR